MRFQTLLLYGLILTGCGANNVFESKDTRREKIELDREKQLLVFASQHGAQHPWFKGSRKIIPFTSEFQEALQSSNGRPIAFDAILEDLVLQLDGYTALFTVHEQNSPELNLRLKLDGPSAELVKTSGKDFDSFFIVAKDLSAKPSKDEANELDVEGACLVIEKHDQTIPST